MGKGSTTTTSTTTPNPQAMSMYSSILDRVNQLGDQGMQLAPMNADQSAAFGTVRGLAGQDSPYLQQAMRYATQGAGTITPEQIAQYYNPYQEAVVRATMGNIDESNEQQRQRLIGNAVAKGAWGGDRAGVAQAELARQQGLARNQTLAGLESQGFSQALAAAQADREAAARGSGAMIGLQGAGLQGAGAQLNIGDLQQKYAQAGLNLPFTTTQWLASIGTGVGSQMGGTSSTTTPRPNPLNQFLGAGLALAGMFLKDGGRVPSKAIGGGLVPAAHDIGLGQMNITPGVGAPKPPEAKASPDSGAGELFDSALGLAAGIRNKFQSRPTDISAASFTPSSVGDNIGSQWSDNDREFQGFYADGGGVADVTPRQRIDEGFEDVESAVSTGDFDAAGINNRESYGPSPEIAASRAPALGLAPDVPLPRPRPAEADEGNDEALEAPTLARPAPGLAPVITEVSAQSRPPTSESVRGLLLSLSPEVRQGLVAAGLSMMASPSSNVGQAIGSAGLKGLETYSGAIKAREAGAKTKFDQDLKLRELDQMQKKADAELALRTRIHEERGGMTDYQKALVAQRGVRPAMDTETADFLAERVIAGDSRALIGLGRGAQGAENLALIQSLVARKAQERGLDARDLLAKVAEQSGQMAQQRTFGTQTARMATASTEALGAIELGKEASALVPRGSWVPITKALQAFQRGTSDPNLYKFGAANLAIINTYARAISPTGVPTVNDKIHAEQLLSTATSPAAYMAILGQMEKEIHIAHAAPTRAKELMESIRRGQNPSQAHAPLATPAVRTPAVAVPPAQQREIGRVYDLPKGKFRWTGSGWTTP